MKKKMSTALKVLSAAALGSVFAFAPAISSSLQGANAKSTHQKPVANSGHKKASSTQTPIKHVVVIFDENVSFDHYFGTYPVAQNPKGEPEFTAAKNTPTVNGLSGPLLTNNPNGANPERLDRSQAVTADMDHSYAAEQSSFDGGKMDKFVANSGHGSNLVMDYYDGNTVTAMWNYAQHFSLNDNSFGTNYGPSTPGALNLISGQDHGVTLYNGNSTNGGTVSKSQPSTGTLSGDTNPYYDNASGTGSTAKMTDSNKNIGDLLNAKGITWGWFQGGFRNSSEQHQNVAGGSSVDYSPHHEPFQYYKSTSNPNHLAPSSPSMIGKTDQANHQYDLTDFWTAADSGNLPAVSYLKAPEYQDGHAGYSDPLDEQTFFTNTINRIQSLPEWKDTAIVIAYDDSDGWYDHVMAPLVNGSNDPALDTLNGQGSAGTSGLDGSLDRAGYGPRLPLLVLSPYAKQNYVDNTLTDQSSILKFIEDNWNLGRIGNGSFDAMAGSIENMFDFSNHGKTAPVYLNPSTGEVENKAQALKQSDFYLKALYKDAGVTEPKQK
ncbi:alkaline phosphatase family protein [Pullulanibacillus sp. KACC 23026]|uniref:phospholipase C n=1 Tax=Pullulanibacillus sp. KACC 23026 TaxID=3028315 RepID=UPI0023B1B1B2|nr:alkaline phosphatase family protein [Pullulanibacillus sp. KACC 23026]WEG12637.1 alkaline phosphatase family protein [Pullulanibacillus sp. KACC 23026]